MQFASDNAGPVPPEILDALAEANAGHAPAYGTDALTLEVADRLREIFEAPSAAVYLVPTGTAANALALATLSQPWQAVFCADNAHIAEDECAAPEFFSGGAPLALVGGRHGKIDVDALGRRIARQGQLGVHNVQRGPISITQATEVGTIYSCDEIAGIGDVAREFGLPLHMDGARFANALVALDCTPAEMTWKAGVDAVSFGGTKNGLMAAEAVILFDPAPAWEFELRRKRAGHLVSKHRYVAAQMAGYLRNDLWLRIAAKANASAARLSVGLDVATGATLSQPVEANMVFATWPGHMHRKLRAAGAEYYIWDSVPDVPDNDTELMARLVCDWSITDAQIDAFLAHFGA